MSRWISFVHKTRRKTNDKQLIEAFWLFYTFEWDNMGSVEFVLYFVTFKIATCHWQSDHQFNQPVSRFERYSYAYKAHLQSMSIVLMIIIICCHWCWRSISDPWRIRWQCMKWHKAWSWHSNHQTVTWK